jgi:hypothetical protein
MYISHDVLNCQKDPLLSLSAFKGISQINPQIKSRNIQVSVRLWDYESNKHCFFRHIPGNLCSHDYHPSIILYIRATLLAYQTIIRQDSDKDGARPLHLATCSDRSTSRLKLLLCHLYLCKPDGWD